MNNDEKLSKAVRVDDIKTFIGFALVLASVIFFGSQLQSSTNQTHDEIIQLKADSRDIANKQNLMSDKITRIETILTTAQNNGQIGKSSSKDFVALAAPTIAAMPTQVPTSQQVTYNAVINQPTIQPTVVPTPAATPTIAQAKTLCVLTVCL